MKFWVGTGFQPVKFGIPPNFVGGYRKPDELEFAEIHTLVSFRQDAGNNRPEAGATDAFASNP
jgi:hypothetical protein